MPHKLHFSRSTHFSIDTVATSVSYLIIFMKLYFLHVYVQAFFNDGMDGMDTEDPFAGLGGLGSGLGAGFAHGRTPFRSQSFNVGSNSAGARHASLPPPFFPCMDLF